MGYEAHLCTSEDEARKLMSTATKGKWPCLFTKSDTTARRILKNFIWTEKRSI